MAPSKNYYQTLGVAASATDDEIKKVYRQLAKKYHPDANPNNEKGSDRFKEIAEAYSVLSDADQRKKYDLMRKLGAFTGGGPGGFRTRSTSSPGGSRSGPTREEFDFGNLGGFGGIGDFFSNVFGKGGRRSAPVEPIEISADLPFRTAVVGGKVTVTVGVSEACPACAGSGAAPGAQVSQCTECAGRGMVSFGQGSFAVNRPCPACRGRGRIPSKVCPRCAGRGDVDINKRLMVTVAPGTRSGTKVRLKGQGQRDPTGGPSGDLLVTFQVLADRFFQREGQDLICTVPINFVQAMLGTKIKIRTVTGKKVILTIPAGTQSGQRFRIRGMGVEKNGKRGDQFVEIAIKVPDNVDESQEQVIKDLAGSLGLKY